MADNVTSDHPSRVALIGSFLAGAGVGAAGMTVAPLVVIVLAAALVIGGDLLASRTPEPVIPKPVHFARATAAGLGVVAVGFVLLQVLDY